MTAITLMALMVPVTAFAQPPSGGHGDADAQATRQHAFDGPGLAGLAWRRDLGVRLENEPADLIRTSNDKIVMVGRAVSDVPGTSEDESDTARGYMTALEPSDGSDAWDAPFMDVEWGCVPVATSDGRIIVHLDARSPTNDDGNNNDSRLVAVDATTGLATGDFYDGEDSGDTRLGPCGRQLLLSPDETTVVVAGSFNFQRSLRFIDISTTPWTQTAQFDVVDKDGDNTDSADAPVLAADGSGVYVTYRWDSDLDPDQWRLGKVDFDGNLVDDVVLPGRANRREAFIAVEGGAVIAQIDCEDAPGNTDDCITRIDDDGSSLSVGWNTLLPDGTDTNPDGFQSLALLDERTAAGYADDNLWSIDILTGDVGWKHDTSSFSNNGGQVLSDASGNLYYSTFGGNVVESVDVDGARRWSIDGCHLTDGVASPGVGELRSFGVIAADGTLAGRANAEVPGTPTQNADPDDISTDLVFGFREGEDLPKGECPEEEERVSGTGRVETAVDISGVSFPQPDSADTVVLATSGNYPDALAGGPLARQLDAPLLLTPTEFLADPVRTEIERLGASTAVLLGGEAALSAAVENELRGMGLTIDRIAGVSRFDTAAQIAARLPSTTAYITEGANADPGRGWPDAVAVSGLASLQQNPILLVTRDVLPEDTADALIDNNISTAVIVGGTSAVSAQVAAEVADPDGDGTAEVTVDRDSGSSRFATSVEVAERSVSEGASTFDLWFATGLAFPDALAAGPAVAKSGGVLLLVHGTVPEGGAEVYTWLEGLAEDQTLRAWFVGGTNAITDEVAAKLASAASIEG